MFDIKSFFDENTFSYTYVVSDAQSGEAAVIDSVCDFNAAAGRISYDSANEVIRYIEERKLKVKHILETHVHADHLTAAPYIKEKCGGEISIGEGVCAVQKAFFNLFNIDKDEKADGHHFDHLLAEGDSVALGDRVLHVMKTPGHTPACVTYYGEGVAFVGDTLFMPDFGSARADFPGGDARELYHSLRKILALPEDTVLYMCHDYAPGGRAYQNETTVALQRANNIHVKDGVSEDEYVSMRTTRDKDLPVPKLLFAAVQINMRAGQLPDRENNGVNYLKIPLNQF